MKICNLLVLLLTGMILVGCNVDGVESSGSSLIIPFRCNGYVTPLDPNLTDSPACADEIVLDGGAKMVNHGEMMSWPPIYEPHQISIFFYTAYKGVIDLDLVISRSYADASLSVEIEGTTQEVLVKDSQKNVVCNVGKYNISKPGYVRVNIKRVDTSGYYPVIKALQVRGKGVGNKTMRCEEVMFVTENDVPIGVSHRPMGYWIRRGPYITFWWDQPENTEYFYNEIYVAEGDDVNGAYYATIGGDKFYMGLQPQKKGDGRCVLFSVWDTNTAAGDVAELVNKNEQVWSNNYSNEGSGIQNFYYYDWEAGRTYATMVRVRPECVEGVLTGNTLYTSYFRGDEGWVFLAEVRRPKISTYLTGAYSFNENYIPAQGWTRRSVSFPSQWMRDKDGVWHEVLGCKFSSNPNNSARGVSKLRYDYKGGVNEDGDFYLTAGGFFGDGRTFNDSYFTRKATGTPPDIDLAALEQLSTVKTQ